MTACVQCGGPLKPRAPAAKGPKPKYCRQACRQAYYEATHGRSTSDAHLPTRIAALSPERQAAAAALFGAWNGRLVGRAGQRATMKVVALSRRLALTGQQPVERLLAHERAPYALSRLLQMAAEQPHIGEAVVQLVGVLMGRLGGCPNALERTLAALQPAAAEGIAETVVDAAHPTWAPPWRLDGWRPGQ